jgi:hypothetical protein
MKKIVAASLVALGLVGCAGAPAWNTSQFPPQPEYGMSTAVVKAEAPAK